MTEGMEIGACSCDSNDYELVAMSSAKEVKARKQHICDECGETVEKGQCYWKWSYFDDGTWTSGKRCIPCKRIGDDYFCGILGRGAVWSYAWDYLGVDLRTGAVKDE